MYEIRTTHSRRGFTLIETFVAITILLVAIVGPMTIAARGLQTAFFAKEQMTAYYLGQEGVEFVRAVRDENALKGSNWLAGVPGHCDPDQNDNGCGVNVRAIDEGGISGGFINCSNQSNACRIYYDDSALGSTRGFYTHQSSGNEETPFIRRIWIDETVSGREAAIVVEVSWPSGLFFGTRTVTIQSRIFNHYDDN